MRLMLELELVTLVIVYRSNECKELFLQTFGKARVSE